MPHDAAEIARLLNARVAVLAPELLPAGHREGAEWRAGSVAGEPGQSLAVHLAGGKAGVWSDFSSGDAGDSLDLVAAVLFRGDRGEALRWARKWLGLGDGPAPAPRRALPPSPPPEQADAEAEARRRKAFQIFLDGLPTLAGTPAADYLRGRGIDLAELGRQPRSLRFGRKVWNTEAARCLPALLAAVTDGAGKFVAVHRTWIEKDDAGIWRKANLKNPKMSLGSLSGGAIRLWRGASGKPFAQAPEGEAVVIGEGIETCLSVVVACPEYRVLCAVSLSNMARLVLPSSVHTVIIAKDNDGDNESAAKALARAIDHFQSEGRIVKIAVPPSGKDFNDTLQGTDK